MWAQNKMREREQEENPPNILKSEPWFGSERHSLLQNNDLSWIPEPTWQKERTDHPSCSLTPTCEL